MKLVLSVLGLQLFIFSHNANDSYSFAAFSLSNPNVNKHVNSPTFTRYQVSASPDDIVKAYKKAKEVSNLSTDFSTDSLINAGAVMSSALKTKTTTATATVSTITLENGKALNNLV